jgi:hypothetical protein
MKPFEKRYPNLAAWIRIYDGCLGHDRRSQSG